MARARFIRKVKFLFWKTFCNKLLQETYKCHGEVAFDSQAPDRITALCSFEAEKFQLSWDDSNVKTCQDILAVCLEDLLRKYGPDRFRLAMNSISPTLTCFRWQKLMQHNHAHPQTRTYLVLSHIKVTSRHNNLLGTCFQALKSQMLQIWVQVQVWFWLKLTSNYHLRSHLGSRKHLRNRFCLRCSQTFAKRNCWPRRCPSAVCWVQRQDCFKGKQIQRILKASAFSSQATHLDFNIAAALWFAARGPFELQMVSSCALVTYASGKFDLPAGRGFVCSPDFLLQPWWTRTAAESLRLEPSKPVKPAGGLQNLTLARSTYN